MKAFTWAGEVTEPGLYLGVPTQDYLDDPCPEPSLNSSTARVALMRSLKKARAKHPRLREFVPEEDEDAEPPKITRVMDIGSAAHSLAFGFGKEVVELHVPNFKTKQAREDRDTIRAGGGIPLKRADYKIAAAMAAVARPIITDLLDGSLVAEAMICCQDEGGAWRRGLVDRARADMRVIIDYKTTGTEVPPMVACDAVYKAVGSPYFQEGFYRRILDRIDPEGRGRRRFCFLYQEQEPPFEPVLVESDEAGRTLAEEQVEAACNLWDRAVMTGSWPGYPLGPHIASPPPWMISAWTRRAESDETLNRFTPEMMEYL